MSSFFFTSTREPGDPEYSPSLEKAIERDNRRFGIAYAILILGAIVWRAFTR